MIKPPLENPLPIGTKVKGYGEVVGVRAEGGEFGERYYFLKDKHGSISFMPASSIEVIS